MKKIGILIATAALALLGSCDLDMYPEDKLVNDQALLSIEDLQKFELGTYAAFRANFNESLIVGGDLQADYTNAVSGFGNIFGPLHTWTYNYADYDVHDVWEACYYTIAQVNYVLSKAGNITCETEEDEATYNIIVGEMYFMRAMSLYQLVEKFCGDYNAATATKEFSGLPVLTGFDPMALPSRSTLENTYGQILADIAEAGNYLAGSAGEPNSTWITEDCITALEARVYLQMHNYPKALEKANSLISGGNYVLAKTVEDLQDIFKYDNGSEVIFVFHASQTELPASFGEQFILDRNSKDDYFVPQYIPTQTLIDLYEDEDIRKEAFYLKAEKGICEINGTKIETPVYLMNKYPGNPKLQTTAGTKNYRNAIKVFRIAEMYLIAAEAAVQTGGDAATPLNALRENRGLAALGSVTLDDVKKERMRELVFEGNRISDLKRWGDGINQRVPQTGTNKDGEAVRLNQPGDSFEKLAIAANDFRFVWPIPSDEIYANQNLVSQQNPGWEK